MSNTVAKKTPPRRPSRPLGESLEDVAKRLYLEGWHRWEIPGLLVSHSRQRGYPVTADTAGRIVRTTLGALND